MRGREVRWQIVLFLLDVKSFPVAVVAKMLHPSRTFALPTAPEPELVHADWTREGR